MQHPRTPVREPQRPTRARLSRDYTASGPVPGLDPQPEPPNSIITRGDEKALAKAQQLLREARAKYERAVETQARMEEEILGRDATIERLETEARDLRRSAQNQESNIAQLTMEFLNGQTKWLDEAAGLNDEIRRLKAKLKDAEAPSGAAENNTDGVNSPPPATPAKRAGWSTSSGATFAGIFGKSPSSATSAKSPKSPPAPQFAAAAPAASEARSERADLERKQQEVLAQELKARIEQLREELQQARELNARLVEENESFQVLVAGKTIKGDLPTLEDELSLDMGASTLDEDEPATPDNTVVETLRGEVKRVRFEVASLLNHNKALHTSLERLVQRLLEDKEFSEAVKETVPVETVRQFSQRVSSLTDQALRQQLAAHAPDGTSRLGGKFRVPSGPLNLHPPGTPAKLNWNRLMFNRRIASGDSGSSQSQRSVSLGVDDHLSEHGDTSPERVPGVGGEVDDGSLFPVQAGSSTASSVTDRVSDRSEQASLTEYPLFVPKRTTKQTALRKLWLTSESSS